VVIALWGAFGLISLRFSPRTTVAGHITEIYNPYRGIRRPGGLPRMSFHCNDGREIHLSMDMSEEAVAQFHPFQPLEVTYTDWDGLVGSTNSTAFVAGDFGNDPNPRELALLGGLLAAAILFRFSGFERGRPREKRKK
jgi:hypothetical protein